MGPRDSRRVLVLAVAVVIASVLALLWLSRTGSTRTVEERVREKAAELKEKARDLTR